MNRAQRREAARAARRSGRNSPQRNCDRNITHNRVAQALLRVRIMGDVQRLRLEASLHAFTGNNAAHLADRMGRLLYTVAHAAALHGLHEMPEASVLRGTANALADIANTPAELERQRGAILAGLSAIDRLLPELHELSLARGALELDQILSARDFTTGDVARALKSKTT
ncbi:hypothetical protein [Acidovorax lacteus]|uniref:Uncharacterized protein n=1 Tax=Acidovorax lacteus TaxID=1924988 RepID=A0ABP8LA15_9BURK